MGIIPGLAWVVSMSMAAAPAADDAAYKREYETWRTGRLQRLTSETGWLSLVGLYWLKGGVQAAGSGKDNALVFPATAPARVGSFAVDGGKVRFTADAAAGVTKDGAAITTVDMVADVDGTPTVLKVGTMAFNVIKRGEKLGIRLKDSAAPTRTGFTGIPTWAYDPRWRVVARWEPFKEPQKLKVPNVLGTMEDMDAPGVAVFTVGGKEHRLQPVLEEGSDELFFIFADETNRTDTYGAGRFLYTAKPKDGTVVLDFNRSYNPPCAFTPYATCPIPPPQNRLATRVEAGEKRYANGH